MKEATPSCCYASTFETLAKDETGVNQWRSGDDLRFEDDLSEDSHCFVPFFSS
ncbi:hypothetical protein KIN20_016972 [Parelaphostrongylus tenuis]|uniref:Uncharacterized protein n=1 Tax=Parelaphostrongylus tenuis TaxID=148309 RepID=A0AAD5N5X4_PARTN|nr:hypothetical protein KIN20_016972 [Parelaphostrongylus tenuis]